METEKKKIGRPKDPQGRGTCIWIKPKNLRAIEEKFKGEETRIVVNKLLETALK